LVDVCPDVESLEEKDDLIICNDMSLKEERRVLRKAHDYFKAHERELLMQIEPPSVRDITSNKREFSDKVKKTAVADSNSIYEETKASGEPVSDSSQGRLTSLGVKGNSDIESELEKFAKKVKSKRSQSAADGELEISPKKQR
jgi:hypothetical protein